MQEFKNLKQNNKPVILNPAKLKHTHIIGWEKVSVWRIFPENVPNWHCTRHKEKVEYYINEVEWNKNILLLSHNKWKLNKSSWNWRGYEELEEAIDENVEVENIKRKELNHIQRIIIHILHKAESQEELEDDLKYIRKNKQEKTHYKSPMLNAINSKANLTIKY